MAKPDDRAKIAQHDSAATAAPEETAAASALPSDESSDTVQVKLNPEFKVPAYSKDLKRTDETPDEVTVEVPGFEPLTLTSAGTSVPVEHAAALKDHPAVEVSD